MTMLDDHQECFRHRVCNVAFPCEVCKLWSAEKRTTIERMIEKARAKLVSATATTESVPSVENPVTLPTASRKYPGIVTKVMYREFFTVGMYTVRLAHLNETMFLTLIQDRKFLDARIVIMIVFCHFQNLLQGAMLTSRIS